MRPTSVIFLILSVILIAGGAVTCVSAQRMADANGLDLFFQETDENNNGLEVTEFEPENVSKITLVLSNVDVNIYGSADKDAIELINFTKNSYEFTMANKNLTVDDSLSLMSLFRITSSGFHFGGLRHYLYFDRYADRTRAVNIYLSENSGVTAFDIQVESGDVVFHDLVRESDYTVTVQEGDVLFDNINMVSSMKVGVVKSGDITCDLQQLSRSAEISTGEGDVLIALTDNHYRAYYLNAPAGSINYFGRDEGKNLEIAPITVTSTLTVTSTSGDISLRQSKVPETSETPEEIQPAA